MAKPRRDQASELAMAIGLVRLIGFLPTRSQLLVLNYHRIGNSEETPYDDQVFSATADGFNEQVGFLKKHFRIIGVDEAIAIAENRSAPGGTAVLLTFDDGYRDNYEIAFPILRNHGVPGLFFLPTSFVGTHLIPWWDEIAFVIRHARVDSLTFPGLPQRSFDLRSDRRTAIDQGLALYKSIPAVQGEPFLDSLAETCKVSRCRDGDRLFMTWDEAVDMVNGGMMFGSHTHTHRVLSQIPEREQRDELDASKQVLEQRLGTAVTTLAYPVGLQNSFSSATRDFARDAGYRLAFSFHGGFNRAGCVDRYNVCRQGISNTIRARFETQVTIAGFTASHWI